MTADATIGNMALSRLGTRSTIASLTENSTEARAINTWFATTRDSILRARNWNFARITRALALTGTAPERWTYSYAYPSDCVRFLSIDNSGLNVGVPFELGSDGVNRFIWTDQDEAYGIFTQRVTDLGRADPEFIAALVDQLAANIALPITLKNDVAVRMAQIARATLDAASAQSANEDAMQGRGGGAFDWEADAITARS